MTEPGPPPGRPDAMVPRDPVDAERGSEDGEPVTAASAATAPPTETRTFLIADIRGYTLYTRDHGDEAAASLAARFAELVAEVVSTREGFLLEVRGDEALVVFVSARKALRAAIDLQARFAEAELARGVGIGLDAGEAIPINDGYRGTALNLAARLCAQAGPGEILASEAVIHLAAKMDGISYVDARSLKLKGYDESVRAVVVVPSDRAKGRRPASGRGSKSHRRSWLSLAVAAVAAIAVIGGAFAGGFVGRSAAPAASGSPAASPGASGGTPSAGPGSSGDGTFALADLPLLAFYDAASGKLEATLPIRSPTRVAFYADGSFWQVHNDPKSVDQIDPITRTVHSFQIPVAQDLGFAFGAGALWFTDQSGPRITRLDRNTGAISTFQVGRDAEDQGQAIDIVVGADSVWFSRPDAQEIDRMDPKTGRIQARIHVVDAFTMDFGNGAVWYGGGGRIGRIDPATDTAGEPITVAKDKDLSNMAFAGGFGWVTEPSGGVMYKLDRDSVVEPIQLAPGIGTPSATADTVWVANNRNGTLTGVDVATGQRRTIDTGHATLNIASSDHELMVGVGPSADDIIGTLGGSVLNLATDAGPWEDPSPDPPNNGSYQVRQMEYLTCLSLLNYPDAPMPAGLELRPEAAEAMPTVSADGRTYTFTIRPGLQFSPPSNEPITAETFRASIERALSPDLIEWAPGLQLIDDIVGAQAYRDRQADSVTGLKAEGDKLSITLNAPTPGFLKRLSLPFYCPVPLGTPPTRLGLDADPPVAGSGPYYLATHLRYRLVVLKKNPNYHGDRPQPWDAIAIRSRISVPDLLSGVQGGLIDGALLPGGDSLVGPGGTLAAQWGPTSEAAAAGDQRWFGARRFGTSFIALNPNRPAFKDLDVRRAVALVLDRGAVAGITARDPTASLLPPIVAGAQTVPGPDIDGAKVLMAGRKLTVTMAVWEGCDECEAIATELAGELRPIGITLKILKTDVYRDATAKDTKVDLVEWGIGSDALDLGAMLPGIDSFGWISSVDNELDRILTLAGPARDSAANELARHVVDESAYVIPYGGETYANYFGAGIGCAFVQPAVGAVDLLSLCKTGDPSPAVPSPSAAPSP